MTRVYSVGHRLDLITGTQISGCLIPFLLAAVTLCSPRWLSRDHCCCGRLKPGCRIVGSSTVEVSLTWADLQFSFHWLLVSKRTRSCHRGFLDGRQVHGRLVISEWVGELLCAIIISTSLSVAAFLRRAGSSVVPEWWDMDEFSIMNDWDMCC